jgi:Dolichyl-phosphate-mannose-protein mannosyltransferase
MTEPLGTWQPTDDETSATWHRILRKAGLVYLFSRVCVLAGAGIVAAELRADINEAKALNIPYADPHLVSQTVPKSGLSFMLDVLSSWDGNWYLRIVRSGYPRHVQPNVTYNVADARAAFFPTYPMLVRAVDKVLPGGDTTAALFTNFVLGAIAIFLLGILARRLYGQQVAAKAMVLAAMFPGSFVLSFAYSEALLLVFAMACLWCLMSRQWLAAGLLATLGTATRPNGLALVLACAVAAGIAIHRDREWRSLAAPLISPLGFVAFQLWLGHHAGEARVWFRVQRQAWNEGASFGVTAVRETFDALSRPLTSPTNTITAASIVTTGLLIYFAYRKRVPWPMLAYSAGILALMLLPSTVTARPRFVYTAFPLFISAAAYLHTVRRDLWPYVIGACSAGLVALPALYGVFGAIP